MITQPNFVGEIIKLFILEFTLIQPKFEQRQNQMQ